MSQHETLEEWRQRTAPSKESIELARTATLSAYVVAGFGIAFLSTFEYGDKLAMLGFLVLWYPTGVLKRRWLTSGASLDDGRLVRLGWVRLGLGLLLMTTVSWGNLRDLLLVAVFALIAFAEMRWHFLEPVGAAVDRVVDAPLTRIKGVFRRS